MLTPLYDGEFSDQSYGFREGRSAHQAVRRVQTAWKQRLRHAIDCDLKAFFDTVNHDRLLNQLRSKIGSGKLLRLIGRYLRAGVVLPDGTREATPLGVPQGGPLSPLLANITLDPLDKEIERRGHVHARYADDFVILVAGAKKAQRVMESVTRFIERKLKLVVNRTKSKSGPLIEGSFLGFCISSRGSIKWTAKAYARFKQRIKNFKHADTSALSAMDGWIRGRLRGILRKRAGLRGRGKGRDRHRWGNDYFTNNGLFSLERARKLESKSLYKTANRELESRMRETRPSGSEGGAAQLNVLFLPLSAGAKRLGDCRGVSAKHFRPSVFCHI